jgi:LPS O-antigen subunit length determinant protein (WzzB/FepE family)
MNHNPGARGGEVNLFEIWQILVARKWLVLSVPVATILLAAVYVMQATPLFECSARVLVGQVGQVGHLGQGVQVVQMEKPAVLVQKLGEKYLVWDKTHFSVRPRVSSISLDKKDTGTIIQIDVVDQSAKGAKLFLEQTVAEILSEQLKVFEQTTEVKRTRLKTLADQLVTLETYQQELARRIAKKDNQDPAQATVLAVEKGSFLKLASELDSERYALQRELDAVNSYPSQLIQVPSLPKKPINVKPSLVILFAGIFGLLLGGVATFFAEFILKFRQKAYLNNSQG